MLASAKQIALEGTQSTCTHASDEQNRVLSHLEENNALLSKHLNELISTSLIGSGLNTRNSAHQIDDVSSTSNALVQGGDKVSCLRSNGQNPTAASLFVAENVVDSPNPLNLVRLSHNKPANVKRSHNTKVSH